MKKYVKPELEQVSLSPEEGVAMIGSVCEETGNCSQGIFWDFAEVLG